MTKVAAPGIYFGFWIEEKGDHSRFFNPKSKIIQNPK